LSMRYSQGLGMEALGMTGKFHTTWGEFGGFKHPNALIYETALSVAMGAKCSVGDQFHPRGKLCPATYELIGPAYARIEALEPWCDGVKNVADVGLLSQESVGQKDPGDRGANRILLEGKFLYDVLDAESDFSRYKVIILPDSIRPEGELLAKLKAFTAAGVKLLCTGSSGMDADGNFLFDLGAKDARPAAHTPAYLLPGEDYDIFSAAPFVVYRPGWEIEAAGEVLAERAEPYLTAPPSISPPISTRPTIPPRREAPPSPKAERASTLRGPFLRNISVWARSPPSECCCACWIGCFPAEKRWRPTCPLRASSPCSTRLGKIATSAICSMPSPSAAARKPRSLRISPPLPMCP
ncbi:MAG: beta-galactosidase trimerization domain-containing protein, partial [Clostridia bacterium]|nr:beta-galactosidase trimerization domain-containing protein [Clostridia bacterium]